MRPLVVSHEPWEERCQPLTHTAWLFFSLKTEEFEFKTLLYVMLYNVLSISAIDCLQCLHITHRSYHGLIRSSLDNLVSPKCPYNNVTIGSDQYSARLVKCDRPGDNAEYKCGLIRGRASVKVDGQNEQGKHRKHSSKRKCFPCLYAVKSECQ